MCKKEKINATITELMGLAKSVKKRSDEDMPVDEVDSRPNIAYCNEMFQQNLFEFAEVEWKSTHCTRILSRTHTHTHTNTHAYTHSKTLTRTPFFRLFFAKSQHLLVAEQRKEEEEEEGREGAKKK